MAVPKRKMSRSNTRNRRAQWKSTPVALSTCDRGHTFRSHTVCPECGRYDKREVLAV